MYSDNLRNIIKNPYFPPSTPTFTSPQKFTINLFWKPTYLLSHQLSLYLETHLISKIKNSSSSFTFIHLKNTSPLYHFTWKLLLYHHLTRVCVKKPIKPIYEGQYETHFFHRTLTLLHLKTSLFVSLPLSHPSSPFNKNNNKPTLFFHFLPTFTSSQITDLYIIISPKKSLSTFTLSLYLEAHLRIKKLISFTLYPYLHFT